MKLFTFFITLLLSLQVFASGINLREKAARHIIETSAGHFNEELYQTFVDYSHVMKDMELAKFGLKTDLNNFDYVLVNVNDCVYDIAIVEIYRKNGKIKEAYYIDSSEMDE